jgi:formate hydrogenlyase regulatory protein HycA
MAFVTGAMPYAFKQGERWDPACRDADDYYRKYKAWYGVLHRFDAEGNHIGSEARLGAPDSEGWDEACAKASHELGQLLREIAQAEPVLCDVWVKPFSVEIDGVLYGLIYGSQYWDDEGAEHEWVMLQPNDIMFHPPWDSGDYST